MVIIMKNRYKVSLLVIAILLAFSMTVGTSYAFWTTTVSQEGTNEVVAGCLKFELNDVLVADDGSTNSTSINLSNAYPTSDANGLTTKPYNLTIKNVCSINADYKIILNKLSDSVLDENNMKYHIVKVSPSETTMEPVLINTLKPISVDDAISEELTKLMGDSIKSSYIIGEGILKAQNNNVTDSVTYNLRLWIDESAGNEVMGSTFESAIAVYAVAVE